MADTAAKRITWLNLAEEPFRVMFPLGVAAALLGVLLWPLHFAGILEFYPGTSHARLMAHGFFGGFIVGFLGTALPRMLSTPPLTILEAGLAALLHGGMSLAHAAGWTQVGDRLFLALACLVFLSMGTRFFRRRDVPPPGFVLVALAWLCGVAGTVLAGLERREELPFFWVTLRPLLQYQGFVLLPILGVGGFLLPRFFGLPNQHDFPESRIPPPGWARKAWQSLAVGCLVLVSFLLEAAGQPGLGNSLRLATCATWFWREVPLHRVPIRGDTLAWGLRVAVILLLLGFLTELAVPTFRVAVLHLVLMGGFGILTLTVATRVVFGHSGRRDLLQGRLRWFKVMVWLMLLGMATRISGDFWPAIMKSHYLYGALLWAAALLLWAWHVLPLVTRPDPEA